jgi:lipid-binding SYLF domain-containing protein
MKKQARNLRAIAVSCALTSAFGIATVAAQPPNYAPGANPPPSLAPRTNVNAPGEPTVPSGDAARDAATQMRQAASVLRRMNEDRGLSQLLAQAKGVFVIPNYTRAALGVGGRGGAGVLLVRSDGTWSDPTFFNYGGISVGLQAGAENGAVAFVLNNRKAVNSFTRQNNNWSLNSSAGLTIVNWSGKAQGSVGKGDVTVWSNTAGLFGDLAVSVTDINFDANETSAYYGRHVASAGDVVNGKIPNPHSAALRRQLANAAAPASRESVSRAVNTTAAQGNPANPGIANDVNAGATTPMSSTAANADEGYGKAPATNAPADQRTAGNRQ